MMRNPFLWKERVACGEPSIFCADHNFCTLEYRAWLALSERERRLKPWPSYRDSLKRYVPRRKRVKESS